MQSWSASGIHSGYYSSKKSRFKSIHVPYGDVGWIEFGPDDVTTARIENLAEQIAHHSNLYYNEATSEITDAEFDALCEALKSLDPNHPQLRRVGAPIPPGSVKVEHRFPMRSLDKATNDDEIAHFVAETTAHGR